MKDDRGIVVSWLVKIVIGLAIAGVILFDAGAIVVNFFGLDGAADEIANQMSTDITAGTITDFEEHELKAQARKEARKREAKLTKFSIDAQGDIHVRLKRTADTLIVSRIPWIEDWGTQTAEGQASTN